MKDFTRKNDKNYTQMPGTGVVLKSHPSVVVQGEINELICHLAVALESISTQFVYLSDLFYIQKGLIEIKKQLAQSPPDKPKIDWDMVTKLEDGIVAMETAMEIYHFSEDDMPTYPTQIHLARAVCQRAERSVVAWHQYEDEHNKDRYYYDEEEDQDNRFMYVVSYLNRLGDYLLSLAKYTKMTKLGVR